jgi:hypothetical protein
MAAARLIAVVLAVGGCASMSVPPGGPEDRDAPRVVSVTPDSGATGVTARSISVQFDEVIAEPPRSGGASGLRQFVLISPVPEDMDVAWRRSRIVVEPQGGFRQGTAYQVTLLPGLADLRGNRLTTPYSWTFATGANVPTGRVTGQIFDWQTEMVAPGAIVFAISRVSERDSIVYVGAADSVGRFSVGPLPPGQYDVVGFVDANGNRRRDAREKWSGVVQASAEDSPAPIELLAIERDTVAPAIIGLQFLDSVSIQVSFDRPIDPVQTLQPVLVRIQRADSTEIEGLYNKLCS